MNARSVIFVTIALAAFAGAPAVAADQEWGTLTGRFVLSGPVPAAQIQRFAGGFGVVAVPVEDLVVHPQNRGVANVVLYLRTKKGVELPVHPDDDFAKVKETEVKVEQRGYRFVPHVSIVRVGQPMVVTNADPNSHDLNLQSITGQNPPLNQIMQAGGRVEYRFRAPENFPVLLSDNIYPWMKGFVYVRDNPFAAVSDTSGRFEIKNLPVGELEFQLRRDGGYVTKATVAGKPVEWKRGVAKLEIKPGENDLGEIMVKFPQN
ncbi:MAG: hypothetical protein U0836_13645 [Pirellulales bacterium]